MSQCIYMCRYVYDERRKETSLGTLAFFFFLSGKSLGLKRFKRYFFLGVLTVNCETNSHTQRNTLELVNQSSRSLALVGIIRNPNQLDSLHFFFSDVDKDKRTDSCIRLLTTLEFDLVSTCHSHSTHHTHKKFNGPRFWSIALFFTVLC